MKFFPQEVSRRRVGWLIVHGVLLAVIGMVMCMVCLDEFKHAELAYWKYRDLGGAVAWLIVATFGLTMIVAGIRSLFHPFLKVERLRNFEKTFLAQVIILILVCGIFMTAVIPFLLIFLYLIPNLAYLAAPEIKWEWLSRPLFKK